MPSPRLLTIFGLFLSSTLLPVANAQDAGRDKLVVETLIRLKRFDVAANEKLQGSVTRHMETVKKTPRFVELARLFSVEKAVPELLTLAKTQPTDTLGVEAMQTAISIGGIKVLEQALGDGTPQECVAFLQASSQSTDTHTAAFFVKYYKTMPGNRQVFTATALAVARSISGQRFLLTEAEAGRLPAEISFAVGNALYNSALPDIQTRAKKVIKQPATADSKPLPPIKELLAKTGDVQKGQELFFKKGTCAKCHKVGSQGKEVGPSLTEIGTKLSKDALFTSILDPSAGVSHNYETYSLITNDGNIITGIKINDTAAETTLRTAEGIDKKVSKQDVDEIFKTGVSIMPADLQRLLSVQELVDVVAYLRTLTKQ